MGLGWTTYAVPGLVALVVALPLAALVLFTRPGRAQNRRLALLLAAQTCVFGVGLSTIALADDAATASGFVGVFMVGSLIMPWAYLAFLATLDTPLVSALQGRRATIILAAAALVSISLWFIVPEHFVTELVVLDEHAYGWDWGPLQALAMGLPFLVALFGLAVAFSVYRRVPADSPRKASAAAYLAAFGFWDGLNVLLIPPIMAGGGTEIVSLLALGQWIPSLGFAVFASILAYGILRTQLFDIDLRIKWGLEKSTIAAIFVAVFFVVSEAAQVVFEDFAGNEFIGIGAAGLLVFAIAPLQRLASRLSDRAMPGVRDTDAYREARKEDVYRAQLEELMADGHVTAKERRALLRLQDMLGLDAQAANRLERDVLDGR